MAQDPLGAPHCKGQRVPGDVLEEPVPRESRDRFSERETGVIGESRQQRLGNTVSVEKVGSWSSQ